MNTRLELLIHVPTLNQGKDEEWGDDNDEFDESDEESWDEEDEFLDEDEYGEDWEEEIEDDLDEDEDEKIIN